METTITLYVNTQSIDEKNIDKKSTFNQSSSISNEDYTVVVDVDEKVIWEGVSLDSTKDKVVIIDIYCESGYDIFGHTGLKSNPKGQFEGVVKNDTNGEGETYSIFFEVFNGDKSRGIYSIDPKLQVNL